MLKQKTLILLIVLILGTIIFPQKAQALPLINPDLLRIKMPSLASPSPSPSPSPSEIASPTPSATANAISSPLASESAEVISPSPSVTTELTSPTPSPSAESKGFLDKFSKTEIILGLTTIFLLSLIILQGRGKKKEPEPPKKTA